MAVESYYTLFKLGIKSDISLSIKSSQESLENVRIIKSSEFENVDLKAEDSLQRLGFQLFVGGDTDKAYLHWKKENQFINFLIESGTSIKVDTNIDDNEIVSVFVLNEAIAMILFQKGYFLLHASAIQFENEASVFMGEPGMGKSTLVAGFAKEGFDVLSDDLVVLTFDDNNMPLLIPGPSRLKIWPRTIEQLGISLDMLQQLYSGSKKMLWNLDNDGISEVVPLKQLYQLVLLEEDLGENQSSFVKLKGSSAIETLFGHSPIPSYFLTDDKRQKRLIDCMRILEKVPFTNMIRPQNFSLIKQQIAYIANQSETK